MAELVSAPPPKTRKRKYPYEAWFVGGWVKLTQGVDFDIEAASMSNNILSFARRNGLEASVQVHREPRLPGNPQAYVYVCGDPIQA
ncbi:MAG: hypothetical protein JHC98_03010 [Thermoleophilaceae bacterium]|nr:hypothetical protein [Thermoleophilaceae bacterium]